MGKDNKRFMQENVPFDKMNKTNSKTLNPNLSKFFSEILFTFSGSCVRIKYSENKSIKQGHFINNMGEPTLLHEVIHVAILQCNKKWK